MQPLRFPRKLQEFSLRRKEKPRNSWDTPASKIFAVQELSADLVLCLFYRACAELSIQTKNATAQSLGFMSPIVISRQIIAEN